MTELLQRYETLVLENAILRQRLAKAEEQAKVLRGEDEMEKEQRDG